MRLVLIALIALCALAGCATGPEGGSSIPWGRPESWEGGGGLMPGLTF